MLCLSCDKLLKDLKATEAKLSTLRQQVTEILQGMHADSLASKRPRIDRDTQEAANENQDETASVATVLFSALYTQSEIHTRV